MVRVVLPVNTAWWAFLSPVFMKFQKTDFSHCSIQFRSYVFESEWPRGRIIYYADWLKNYKPIHIYTLPVKNGHQEHRMEQWLMAKNHRSYSLLQLVAIGVGIISPRLRKWLFSNSLNGSGSVICTEFVGEFLMHFYGYDFNKPNDFIDLVDIKKACEEITKNSV